MDTYEHTQHSRFMMLLVLLSGVGAAAALALAGQPAMIGLVVLVSAGMFLLIGSLTVRIGHEALRISFGIGLIRRTIPLADILSCTETRTRWFEGIGIHLSFRGWIYNVSGMGAVLITRRNGITIILGTDEPAALCAALQAALAAYGPSGLRSR